MLRTATWNKYMLVFITITLNSSVKSKTKSFLLKFSFVITFSRIHAFVPATENKVVSNMHYQAAWRYFYGVFPRLLIQHINFKFSLIVKVNFALKFLFIWYKFNWWIERVHQIYNFISFGFMGCEIMYSRFIKSEEKKSFRTLLKLEETFVFTRCIVPW